MLLLASLARLAKVRLDYYLLFNAGRLKALFSSAVEGLRPNELLLLLSFLTFNWTNKPTFLGLFLLYNFQVFDMYRARLMSIFPLWMKSKFRRPLKSCHPQQRRAQGNCLLDGAAGQPAKGIMQVFLSRGLALLLPNLEFLAAAKNSFPEICNSDALMDTLLI